MKKYVYEEVEYSSFLGCITENYREIIDSYAKRGYRFVAAVPTRVSGYGKNLCRA